MLLQEGANAFASAGGFCWVLVVSGGCLLGSQQGPIVALCERIEWIEAVWACWVP